MSEYPIPQFIEEEGKIIFFMTYRQFFLLVGGGAISLFLYVTVPFGIFAVGAIFIMGSVGIIAFLKINNESVIKLALHFIGFSMGQKNYVWKRKEYAYPSNTEEQDVVSQKVKLVQPSKTPAPGLTIGRLSQTKKFLELKKK